MSRHATSMIFTTLAAGALTTMVASAAPSAKIPDAETHAMYRAAGLVERNGQWLDGCEQPVRPRVDVRTDVIDLNGDGRPEAFVTVASAPGGVACYGNSGTELSLLVKGADGKWRRNLGVPAAGYRVLPEKSEGYPDVEVRGPWSCFPVWRWNGREYAVHKRCDR